jgi:dTDP-D-glucose 4,6-dehydratase
LEVDLLCKSKISEKDVNFKETRKMNVRYYASDNSKISRLWPPKCDVKTTILGILEWIKENEKELRWIFV